MKRSVVGMCLAVAAATAGLMPVMAEAATKTWVGTTVNWETASNWSPAGIPGPTDDVVINGGTAQPTLNFNAAGITLPVTINSLSIGTSVSKTLTFQNGMSNNNMNKKLRVNGNATIGANGILTHTPETATGYPGAAENHRLFLDVGGNLTIAAGGLINVRACGYGGNTGNNWEGYGPGAGRSDGNSAGHGGEGGYQQAPGFGSSSTYDSVTNPERSGSGTGYGNVMRGGGTVKLWVGSQLALNGQILADVNNGHWFVGSGGTINIKAGTLTGNGTVTAAGGWGNMSGSGGGRIAIELTAADSSAFNSLTILAHGGTGGGNGTPTAQHQGGAGTIYLKATDSPSGCGRLIVDNNNNPRGTLRKTLINSTVGNITVGDVILRNMGRLSYDSPARSVTAYGNWSNGGGDPASAQATVTLAGGAAAQVLGNNNWFRLTINQPGKTVSFQNGVTQTISATGALTLTGASGNLLVLNSTSPGNQWLLNAIAGSTKSVQYVNVTDSYASGTTIAALYSTGLGQNNYNWTFGAQTYTWTGTSGPNWNTAGSWSPNGIPSATDSAIIPDVATDPVLNANAEVSALTVQSGGSLNLNGRNLTVNGNLTVSGTLTATGTEVLTAVGDVTFGAGSTVIPAQSTLTLAGTGPKTVSLGGKTFYGLNITDTALVTFTTPFTTRDLTFPSTTFAVQFLDDFTAMSVIARVSGASTLTFGSGKTYTIDTLALLGAAANKMVLTSTGTWYLHVTGYAGVGNAVVDDSDATGFKTILAANSQNNGGNLNWDFGTNNKVWVGTSTPWTTAGNWLPSGEPGAGDHVLILGGAVQPTVTLIAGTKTIESLAVLNSSTLTFDSGDVGSKKLRINGDAFVGQNAALTHTAETATGWGAGTQPENHRLFLDVGGDLTIAADAQINVRERGYGGGTGNNDGYGPGASRNDGTSAGHGGEGGQSSANASGSTYDSVTDPVRSGSGTGYNLRGGGTVKLLVGEQLVLNGQISADCNHGHFMYGSGGSVNITAGTLTGNGTITAAGANCWMSGSGGGRIAVVLTDADSSAFNALTIRAPGGTGGGDGSPTALHQGGAGTIYLKATDSPSGYGRLIVDNNSNALGTSRKTLVNAAVGNITVGDVILRNMGRLSYDSTARSVTVYGNWSNGGGDAGSAAANVTLAGPDAATVLGDNTWGHLTINAAGKVVSFQAGKTQTILGVPTFDNDVTLLSTAAPTRWNLKKGTPGSIQNVGLVRVSDSYAGDGMTFKANDLGTDLGNNINWLFNHTPVARCRNVTVNAGANCTAEASIDDGSSDPDGDVLALTQTPPAPYALGTTLVTLTVDDGRGKSSACEATVTVEDHAAPVPDVASLPDAVGQCSASVTAPTATDNCAGPLTGTTPDPTTYTAQGSYVVTWTYDDGHGNITVQGQNVHVEDTTPPVVTCPDDITAPPDGVVQPCSASGLVVGEATASDNCGEVSLASARSDGRPLSDPYYEGTTRITWTATDAVGNQASCTQEVTVVDDEAPTFVAPADMVVSMNPNPAEPWACYQNGNVMGANVTYPAVTPVDNVPGAKVDVYFDPPSGSFFSYAAPNGNLANVHTVTCWAIDECGNRSADATFTVTVQDNLPPQFVDNTPPWFLEECAGLVLTNDAGECFSYQVFLSPTAEDGCDPLLVMMGVSAGRTNLLLNPPQWEAIALVAVDPEDPDPAAYSATNALFEIAGAFPVGTNWLTVTATDGAGNSTRRMCEVVVVDGEAPVITLAGDNPATVECHTAYTEAGATVSGACDENVAVSVAGEVDVNTPGEYARVYSAVDAAGNAAEPVIRTVTVEDTTQPEITILGENPATVECHAGYTDAGATAADDCAGDLTAAIVTDNPVDADTPALYDVTYTVSDPSGNRQSVQRAVLVEDTTPPTVLAKDITVALDDVGQALIDAADVDNGSSDLCGAVALTVKPSAFDCAKVGENAVTLTGVDQKGNAATAPATVTVVDDLPPVAKTRAVTVELDATGAASITAGVVDDGSRDNCGLASLAVAPDAFTCAHVGANAVVLTVTDVHGLVSTADAVVTVEDNVPPMAMAKDVTVELDAAGNAAVTAAQVDNGSSDACGIYSLSVAPEAFTCAHVGVNTVVLTVTDVNGNVAAANAEVTVLDTTAPTLEGVPADATVECDAIPEAAAVTAADNCDAALPVEFSEVNSVVEGVGTIVRTWTVTDGAGNTTAASQTLTVQDSTAPALAGVPADATVECDEIPEAAVVAAYDTCDPTLEVEFDEVRSLLEGVGTIVRTWTVTDSAGNTTAASQTLTVQDSTAPALAGVPADATVECDAIPEAAVVTANDNCDPTLQVEFSEVNSVVEGVGTIVRTWTVTDNGGNTTAASQTLTVQDSTAPALAGVPADATVECDAIPEAAVVTASDNCDPTLQVEFSEVNSVVEGVGTIVRTWTVTDNGGNTTAASQTLTVQDSTAPALEGVPADATVECDAIPEAAIVTASDNCDPTLQVEFSEVNSVVEGAGTIVRTWTVTDNGGNTTTATQTLTVIDTSAPAIVVCPAARTIVSEPTSCTTTVPDLVPEVVASDNCGSLTVTQSPAAGAPLGLGLTVVTITVVDASGNQSTCTVNVTVVGGVKVAFTSPLEDDNNPAVTAIPGLIGNKVRRGQVLPHKVVVTSCSGQALTAGITVKVRVQGLEISGSTLSVFNDVIEDANGVGSDGSLGNDGIMMLTDGKYQFNLDTSNFTDANTFGNANRFYRSLVTVFDSAGNLLGQEDAILETR